ncbi:35796_t:CDS:2, partial [Gigaspora margarita]
TVSKKVQRSWTVREKLMVIYYSEHAQNNKATRRRFDIEPKQVHDWQSKKQELLNSVLYLLTLNHGQPVQYLLLEERLIGESWDNINPRIIRKAFKYCSISVATDGSEDDLVFDYEALGEDLKNVNEENIEESNTNDISGEKYEETK